NNTDNSSYRQPDLAEQPSVQTTSNINQQLTSNVSLLQGLGWGKLKLATEHRFDFLDEDIFPRNERGELIPDELLTAEQQQAREEALQRRQQGNYINKLPGLTLSVNPFFQDLLPVSVSGSIGRYFESQQFNLDRLGTNLLDIVRGEFNLNINSKELDL